MSLNPVIESGCEWTSPDARGICGFCGGEENGYALRAEDGTWKPACWPCAKPKNPPVIVTKKAQVGTTYTEDLDAESAKPKSKSPGMASNTHRPKVN